MNSVREEVVEQEGVPELPPRPLSERGRKTSLPWGTWTVEEEGSESSRLGECNGTYPLVEFVTGQLTSPSSSRPFIFFPCLPSFVFPTVTPSPPPVPCPLPPHCSRVNHSRMNVVRGLNLKGNQECRWGLSIVTNGDKRLLLFLRVSPIRSTRSRCVVKSFTVLVSRLSADEQPCPPCQRERGPKEDGYPGLPLRRALSPPDFLWVSSVSLLRPSSSERVLPSSSFPTRPASPRASTPISGYKDVGRFGLFT